MRSALKFAKEKGGALEKSDDFKIFYGYYLTTGKRE